MLLSEVKEAGPKIRMPGAESTIPAEPPVEVKFAGPVPPSAMPEPRVITPAALTAIVELFVEGVTRFCTVIAFGSVSVTAPGALKLTTLKSPPFAVVKFNVLALVPVTVTATAPVAALPFSVLPAVTMVLPLFTTLTSFALEITTLPPIALLAAVRETLPGLKMELA